SADPTMTGNKNCNWSEAAAKFARELSRNRLHEQVLRWAATRPSRETWAVAFSGGADSLALLLLLWAHWPERRARLLALHFDHRLRGRESRADVIFCRKVCAALGIKLMVGVWPGRHRDVSEGEARAA